MPVYLTWRWTLKGALFEWKSATESVLCVLLSPAKFVLCSADQTHVSMTKLVGPHPCCQAKTSDSHKTNFESGRFPVLSSREGPISGIRPEESPPNWARRVWLHFLSLSCFLFYLSFSTNNDIVCFESGKAWERKKKIRCDRWSLLYGTKSDSQPSSRQTTR